ncbi:hypothetical protein D910_12239 [Dendroctonus ponderosae]|uniref:Reverse transcriptase domain-containing protein n=1 Tax=Dendroctonus ponderosae TaxID=77166 RepID=U4UPC0_DENPD|nr:hypothetical protein D910_12239 [Dendroctonus ponderosae]
MTFPSEELANSKKNQKHYGLPKIHKSDVPLRPIVSAIGSPTYDIAKYLTRLKIGKTGSFIKDSSHFAQRLHSLSLAPGEILVSFDVVSLFTMVPIREAMEFIEREFPPGIAKLFEHCLTTTYSQWENEFYEHTDGVAMGSPFSSAIANYFMEKLEMNALDTAARKPKCWFRYVDDTFVFTIKVEKDGRPPFLDVLLTRKTNGKLDLTVYRKPTHTDRYLHSGSNHHPSQKKGVIRTLTERARRICEPSELERELKHQERAFGWNGYSKNEFNRAIRPRNSGGCPEKTDTHDERKGWACLSYIHGVTDRIGRILEKHKVKKLGQTEQSAVAKHALLDDHQICFDEVDILHQSQRYYPRLTREAIEIFKHDNNFNRKEEVTALNPDWKRLLLQTVCAPKHLKPRSLPTHELTRPDRINTTGDPVVEPVLGSVLGPTLFNIYMADFPTNANTKCYIYADDVALTAAGKGANITTRLQRHLGQVQQWSRNWKMQFNPEKTQAIFFTRGSKTPPAILELAGQRLPWRSKVTYLGLIYDKRLAYYPLLTGKLYLRTKVRAYKQLIRPVRTYGSTA